MKLDFKLPNEGELHIETTPMRESSLFALELFLGAGLVLGFSLAFIWTLR